MQPPEASANHHFQTTTSVRLPKIATLAAHGVLSEHKCLVKHFGHLLQIWVPLSVDLTQLVYQYIIDFEPHGRRFGFALPVFPCLVLENFVAFVKSTATPTPMPDLGRTILPCMS